MNFVWIFTNSAKHFRRFTYLIKLEMCVFSSALRLLLGWDHGWTRKRTNKSLEWRNLYGMAALAVACAFVKLGYGGFFIDFVWVDWVVCWRKKVKKSLVLGSMVVKII